MVRPEIQAELGRIVSGFHQECLRVLDDTARLRGAMQEPPEGWCEYFTRRLYTRLLKYKEEVEAVVEAHLTTEEKV